jgi:hypothetical protein
MSDKIKGHSALYGYTWWLLKTNLGWETSNYGGRIPIVPFSDEPAFTGGDFPYLIYGFTEGADPQINLINNGMITFMIRSKHLDDINAVVKVLSDAFRREDDAARDINKFIDDAMPESFRKMTFQTTRITYIEPGSPEESQEGRVTGIVSISYNYTDTPSTTTSPASGKFSV